MPTLRSKLIRLAHTNPTLRAELLPLLRKTSRLSISGKEITGTDVRIIVGQDGTRADMIITIQELPGIPVKRRLDYVEYEAGRLSGRSWYPSFRDENGAYLTTLSVGWLFGAENIATKANFNTSMSFSQARTALERAVAGAVSEYHRYMKDIFRRYQPYKYENRKLVPATDRDLQQALQWASQGAAGAIREEQVSWLTVEPADYKPISFSGTDFTGTSQWQEFSFAPKKQDEFMVHNEGMREFYKQKSAGAARKLFKMLKKKPDVVRSMNLEQFKMLLDKNRIRYEYVPTVWR